MFSAIPTGTVGARIAGVDVRQAAGSLLDAILSAWYVHDVLIFPQQRLSDDDLVTFSRHLGVLDSPPNQGAGRKSPPGYPDIYVVSNVKDAEGEPIGALGYGEAAWHTDMSYLPIPPDASMLYALEVPPRGGDTSFCSMKAAARKLPPPLKARIQDLSIKHDGTYDSGGNLRKGMQPSDDPSRSVGTPHPILLEHPVSGECCLYLGRRRNAYIVGLTLAESERLLDEIWSYAEAAVYVHQWSAGDLVLWDNRSTMHRRDEFDPRDRRIMHRTQIRGSVPPRGWLAPPEKV